MKLHLSLICALLSVASAAKADPQSVQEVVQAVGESTEVIKEVLNKPIVVLDANNDTILSTVVDSVMHEGTLVIKTGTKSADYENVDIKEPQVDNSEAYYRDREVARNNNETKIIALGIMMPCIVIVILVLALFIFLIIKNRGRNKLIETAILNNYQLPDSFYTGREPVSNTTTASAPGAMPENDAQLPPLPNQPPVAPATPGTQGMGNRFSNLNYFERRQAVNAMVLMGIGVIVFLFFVFVGSVAVGFLIGGIPFIIGASRLATVLYINGRR